MLSPAPSPFKATSVPPGLHRLGGCSVLACAGADAAAFLQAQLMNDVRALVPGRWQWNGWLNPKGRVICLFALWQRDEQEFWLLLPDFPAAELQALLQRYVFRSKLRLLAREDWLLAGSFDAAAGGADARLDQAQANGEAWDFDLRAEGGARRWQLSPAEAGLAMPADPGFDLAWRDADLAHGLPRLDAGQREAWTPQMLSLERLRAFSLDKGCYPGQEIVARTHYLGQAKRALVRLAASGLQAGAAVTAPEGRALGTVVGVGGGEAVAVLSSDAPESLRVDGREVARQALLEGMQRPV